jgi:hypothetical protein
MNLHALLGHPKPAPGTLPGFIRDLQDIRGVRVLRLQGSVGKDIGLEAQEAERQARASGAFSRPLLFDFKDATCSDFATVSYLVLALRRRMAAHAQVGIINTPRQLLSELEIAKLGGLIRVFASEEEALAELSTPRTDAAD